MDKNEDVVVSAQGADMDQKGGFLAIFFTTEANALMRIFVKDIYK